MKGLSVYRKINLKFLVVVAMLLCINSLCSHAQIAGIVFKDFNNNGIQNPPNELGLRNITVSVFVGSSVVPLVTQTDINGAYSFSAAQVPAGSKVRVEFTGVGANNDGAAGGQSKTNVQFLTVPLGGATGVSLGVLTNNDFCVIEGALVFTPCYVNGNPLGGGSSGSDDALVAFPYTASGVAGTTGVMPDHIAKASEVGALWGIDYQGRGKTLITSAVVRRHVGLGSLGTGGIYKYPVGGSMIPLIDVKTIGINTGPDPHTDLPNDKLLSSQDAASMAASGTVGIGGIALSADEKTLFMVNLYDRKLYSFFVGLPANTPNASSVKSYPIPNPCSDGDYRPWSVKEYNGKLYLGVVCSGETTKDSTKLQGTIYEFNPKTGIFNLYYQFPLTYKRGQADATLDCKNIRYWKPWSNTFVKACATFFDTGTGKTVGFAVNPQPIIADLEFDTDGSLVIGLMDRYGLMTGFRALAPVDDGKLYDGFVSGDILRVYNNNGVFEMESNGHAGPLTGSGVGNDEGFGGGEFYGRDYWKYYGKPAHSEIANGGLLLLPGTGEIWTSVMDPVDEVIHSGGFHVYNNTNGAFVKSYAVYAGKPGSLGKSGGVGDFKASCDDPYIELGNRIWYDANRDGIQDPTEDGIDGLTVTLHDMDKGGIQVASTITQNGGLYVFNKANVPDTVRYEHHYQIRLQMAQSILTNRTLIQVSPGGVPPLPDTPESPSEMRDSDAQLLSGFAVIDFMTGAFTSSNHSLDIGLMGCLPPTNITASSNSPVILGGTINLSSSSTNGTTYAWTGPNGFSSSLQNPAINAASSQMSGTYTVTVLSQGTCTATATTKVLVNCTKPNAGKDTAFCMPKLSYKLANAGQYQYWKTVALNPTGAVIDSITGQVNGMTKAGTYRFRLINGTDPKYSCEDTVAITLHALPIYSIQITQTTCAGPTPSNDGKITLTQSYISTDRYDLVKASSYTGTLTYALAKPIPSGGVLMKNINNPTVNESYSVRVINQFGCVGKDSSVVLNKNICGCTKPNAGKDTAFCMPKLSYKLANAGQYQYWKTVALNPTGAVIDSISGQVNGMTKAGTYRFRLINGTDPKYSCEDTVAITLNDLPVFSLQAIQTTCAGPTAKNDGQIIISGYAIGNKYDLQKSATYNGVLTYSLAKVIPNDGVLLKNIPNSSTNDLYVVRVISPANCYKDNFVTLLPNVCTCPQNLCVEFKVKPVKQK